MTQREIIERVTQHLLYQNSKSLLPNGHCAYRGQDGKKCALGTLIDCEHYNEGLEGLTVLDELVREALKKSRIDVDRLTLLVLEACQAIHDYASVEYWADYLTELKSLSSRQELKDFTSAIVQLHVGH